MKHERLRQPDVAVIRRMRDEGIVKGLKIVPGVHSPCNGYILGKSHRLSIPKSRQRRSNSLVELVNRDAMRSFEFKTLGGSRYVVTFIDD